MTNTIVMNCIFESCQRGMVNALWVKENSDEELGVIISTWEHNQTVSTLGSILCFEHSGSIWYVKRRKPEDYDYSGVPAFKYVASPHQKDTYDKKLLSDALKKLKLTIDEDIKSEAEKIDSVKADASS